MNFNFSRFALSVCVAAFALMSVSCVKPSDLVQGGHVERDYTKTNYDEYDCNDAAIFMMSASIRMNDERDYVVTTTTPSHFASFRETFAYSVSSYARFPEVTDDSNYSEMDFLSDGYRFTSRAGDVLYCHKRW